MGKRNCSKPKMVRLRLAGRHRDRRRKMAPIVKQKRLDIYQNYIQKLFKKESCYKCFCSEQDLEEQQSMRKGQAHGYSGKCRSLTTEQVEKIRKTRKELCCQI